MARIPRPVPGDGRGERVREAYAAFARDLLSGAIKATELHDQTAPDGFVTVTVREFIEDPRGPDRSQRDDGTFVQGRFVPVEVQSPRVRIVGMHYTDPNVPGEDTATPPRPRRLQ